MENRGQGSLEDFLAVSALTFCHLLPNDRIRTNLQQVAAITPEARAWIVLYRSEATTGVYACGRILNLKLARSDPLCSVFGRLIFRSPAAAARYSRPRPPAASSPRTPA